MSPHQEPRLFSNTIADNISYGMEHAPPSRQQVEEAARAANAHDFIMALPKVGCSGPSVVCGAWGGLVKALSSVVKRHSAPRLWGCGLGRHPHGAACATKRGLHLRMCRVHPSPPLTINFYACPVVSRGVFLANTFPYSTLSRPPGLRHARDRQAAVGGPEAAPGTGAGPHTQVGGGDRTRRQGCTRRARRSNLQQRR